MSLLDPMEVAEIAVYLFYDLGRKLEGESNEVRNRRVPDTLNAAEYTLYHKLLQESDSKVIPVEKEPKTMTRIELPQGFRRRIIPTNVFERRNHPDLKIARSARTIAGLADVISRRKASPGLRLALSKRVKRLEDMVSRRATEACNSPLSENLTGEEDTEYPGLF